jgi:regulator of extracellular matrix RemA (YlzA/DUF370 family)
MNTLLCPSPLKRDLESARDTGGKEDETKGRKKTKTIDIQHLT